VVRDFKFYGISRMAISLDGPDAQSHDSFRGVPGTFDCAVAALEDARRIGLDTQVQTTVTRRNMHRLDEIAEWSSG
jgi:MoaA/NifB/PqqE/SkfB family radical SAM enzyme